MGGARRRGRSPPEVIDVDAPGIALGRSAAANLGLRSVTGEMALVLDDDDLLAPDHVANLVGALHEFTCRKNHHLWAFRAIEKYATNGTILSIDSRHKRPSGEQ
jgi:hypothetical protein